jgi:hypothetical protein
MNVASTNAAGAYTLPYRVEDDAIANTNGRGDKTCPLSSLPKRTPATSKSLNRTLIAQIY